MKPLTYRWINLFGSWSLSETVHLSENMILWGAHTFASIRDGSATSWLMNFGWTSIPRGEFWSELVWKERRTISSFILVVLSGV